MRQKRILSVLLTLCLTMALMPAETVQAAGTAHIMNESNNWDIHTELIEPGDSFQTVEKLNESTRTNPGMQDTEIIIHENAELRLAGLRADTSSLIRNEADTDRITASSTGEVSLVSNDENPGTKSVTTGYTNNTDLPFTISWAGSGSESCGEVWLIGGQGQKIQTLTEASYTYKDAPFITFYEPYYTISYDNMTDEEQEGLPDRYTITNAAQQIVLPKLTNHRPGEHFYGYSGPEWFDDRYNKTETDDAIIYTYSWNYFKIDHNFPLRDVTIQANYVPGPTLTFHTDGGTLDGVLIEAPMEAGAESGSVDLSAYKPTKAGYTFAGWSPDDYNRFDSILSDDSVDWSAGVSNPKGGDLQLYALWLEGEGDDVKEKDKALLEQGYYFDEATGELTIAYDDGIENWYQANDEAYDNGVANGYRDQTFFRTIKSAVLMEGVTEISHGIFKGCTNLTAVLLPSTLWNVEDEAFAYCNSLTSLDFPNPNGINIGNNAFMGCTALRDVTFGTMDAESPFTAYDSDRAFQFTNPNLKIHVDPFVEEAVKAYLPVYAHRINTADTTEYYGLVVNGEHLSDRHLTVPCGDGTAVYDPRANTLTLNNATITKSDPNGAFWWDYPDAYNREDIWHPLNGKVGIFSTLPQLNIVLNGTNTVTDMGANTADRGDGTVEAEAYAIYSGNGTANLSGSGTLRYVDGNNENARAVSAFYLVDVNRTASVALDGVTFGGKQRIDSIVPGAFSIEKATLEDSYILSDGPLTISSSTVNCSKLGQSYDEAIRSMDRITFDHSNITLNDPITGYEKLYINGGYLNSRSDRPKPLQTAWRDQYAGIPH